MKDIDIIIKYLSESRISTYQDLLKVFSDKLKISNSLDLYKININFSKEIYELLSYFEIFFRNKIDMILTEYICENWIDTITLGEKSSLQFEKIKEDLKKERKEYNKDNLISNLQLGFWVHLFDNSNKALWYKGLNRIFPRGTNRQDIFGKLDKIRKLRNRVSHYEIIIKNLDLLTDTINITMDILEIIDKTIHKWTYNNCEIFQKLDFIRKNKKTSS